MKRKKRMIPLLTMMCIIVGAMEQPGWGSHPAAPVARALQLVMVGNEKSRTKEGAYQFMKFFTTPENQAAWSMATGYVPVRKSTMDVDVYQEYIQSKIAQKALDN